MQKRRALGVALWLVPGRVIRESLEAELLEQLVARPTMGTWVLSSGRREAAGAGRALLHMHSDDYPLPAPLRQPPRLCRFARPGSAAPWSVALIKSLRKAWSRPTSWTSMKPRS